MDSTQALDDKAIDAAIREWMASDDMSADGFRLRMRAAIAAALAQGEAAQPAAEGLAERTAALSSFLDALDEWGCEDNGERAKAIIQFINGGCDLSEYEDRPAPPNAASQDGGRDQ